MNSTPNPDENLRTLEEHARLTRATALSNPTREHLVAHGHAILACWDATSSSTHEAATCGPTIPHTERPL
jgi:hypothetical protein